MASQWPHMYVLKEAKSEAMAELIEDILNAPLPRVRSEAPDGAYLAAAHLLHLLGRL